MDTKLLIHELELVLQYYKLPDADFCWSSYDDAKSAVADMNRVISALKHGDTNIINDIKLMFAPTGSVQEISISSGWGDEFIEIAGRVDKYLR